jgi:hypothetical protein
MFFLFVFQIYFAHRMEADRKRPRHEAGFCRVGLYHSLLGCEAHSLTGCGTIFLITDYQLIMNFKNWKIYKFINLKIYFTPCTVRGSTLKPLSV